MRRLPVILSMISMIVLSASIAPASAQGTLAPTLLAEITIGDSRNIKLPSITAAGQTITIGGGVNTGSGNNNTDAFTWTLAEQATSIGAGVSIGPALGQADYSTVAVAAAPDGSLYAAWSSIKDARIYLRYRDTSGAWGPMRTVVAGGFPIFPQVAVASTGQVFVAWQDINKPLFVKVSSDQGASWPNTFATAEKAYSVPPMITAGANGEVVAGFTTVNLAAAIAVWTGSGFSTEIISSSGADATVAIGTNGRFYAAWRGLDGSGANSGVFYAERQAANSWVKAQLIPGDVKGAVNVAVDSGGTVHLGWIANASGSLRFYYAFRPTGQAQFTTAVGSNVSGLFNSRMAISSSGTFAHAALENFSGSKPYITYDRFSGGATPPGAAPKIEGDAAMIKSQSAVSVSFVNVNSSPTQVRWRWGSAPTDVDSDSGGWQTYASPMTVGLPDTVLNAATCLPTRLYTQVRTAAQVMGSAQFDEVIIDAGVTAAVSLANPHLMRRSAQFSDLGATPNDLGSDSGASDGDPTYTRDPLAYVEIHGLNECSGISDMSTARSTTSIAPSRKVLKDFFANVLPFPGTFVVGSNTVMVRINDVIGNSKDYTQALTYDVTPPILDSATPGSVTATADPKGTILTSLAFSNIKVTDDAYPGGFWGVWIANSRTAVADPLIDTSLVWAPAAAPSNSTSFTIANWSLATGLTSDKLTTGSYTIYARFLDGAGNPTTGVISTTLNLTQPVILPQVLLPVVRR